MRAIVFPLATPPRVTTVWHKPFSVERPPKGGIPKLTVFIPHGRDHALDGTPASGKTLRNMKRFILSPFARKTVQTACRFPLSSYICPFPLDFPLHL
jgi:hypothetical protein